LTVDLFLAFDLTVYQVIDIVSFAKPHIRDLK